MGAVIAPGFRAVTLTVPSKVSGRRRGRSTKG